MDSANSPSSNVIHLKRPVLFGDCDPEGIVYTPRFAFFAVEAIHDALAIWLDDGSGEYHKHGGGLRRLMGYDILPPARAFNLEFLHPVTWDEVLDIRVSVANVSDRSFTFHIEGWLDKSRLTEAKNVQVFSADLTQVCADPKTVKSMPIPAELKSILQRLVAEP